MPVSFMIKVTKEILGITKDCGTNDEVEMIGDNCPIVEALKDIFPQVHVSGDDIYPNGIDEDNEQSDLTIPMPENAKDFVHAFDSLSEFPDQRLQLSEFEFEIIIPDEIIWQINIDALEPCVCA